MRPIYINHQNVKGSILLLGVEFAHMCASQKKRRKKCGEKELIRSFLE